jgi:transcriptional regulator with XRE-family HTH domain
MPLALRIDPDRLRHEAGRRGLSQRQLAKLAGLTEPGLSRIMQGQPARPSTIRRLAAVLIATPVIEGVEMVVGGGE